MPSKHYQNGVTLITPTGHRKLCMKRCIEYINRQTHRPNQWIIADNGLNQTVEELKHLINSDIQLTIINNKEFAQFKKKAKQFICNIKSTLPLIKYDKIFVIEDDDWYSKRYIEKSLVRFSTSRSHVIGEKFTVYYNVASRSYRVCRNDNHASLFQTAFRSNFITKVDKYCDVNRGSAFLDKRIWNHCRDNETPHTLFNTEKLAIGIKGMPGRKGIGIGHRMDIRNDVYWRYLRKLIGIEDAEYYEGLTYKKR